LSFVCAFLLPAEATNRLRGIQKLFSPVSWPARKVAASLRERFDKPESSDHRAAEDVKAENAELRTQVLNLSGQLDEMRRINQEFEQLGELRPLCTRFHVNGNDTSPTRDSLAIPATTFDGVEPMMPVIFSVGIVGRIERVGAAGAQVQLITDPKFGASGRFARFVEGKPVIVKTDQPFLTGAGRGLMQIANIPLRQTKGNVPDDPEAGVDVGHYIILDDPAWPLCLKSRVLGQVISISKQANAPTTALIRVQPILTLSTLREVMVMNKTTPEDTVRTAVEKKRG
jgi:hypothetical protein